MTDLDMDEFPRSWFGYGRWSAPYWFVGMEPGGAEIEANLALWARQGREDLTEITIRYRETDDDWFAPDSPVQRTWQKLIWLLLAYKGEDPNASATIDYQRTSLGRLDGETALVELSPFAAIDTAVDVSRLRNRSYRIDRLREHMLASKPELVVFYSGNAKYLEAWRAIAGVPMVEGRPVLVGASACVVTYHPNHKWDRAYWVEIAARLRAARGEKRA